ncbi:hypothetical protein IV203_029610 [Nitzschia inconspicua]|uniref:Uncharacterized protein n=1 Tax=Nitzschia inconspicua TaxID=303405 RepID=A0A9K3Q1E2_9STRA|nr:hypothetical protein IV203_029610 [Nitzschia inconspicua]
MAPASTSTKTRIRSTKGRRPRTVNEDSMMTDEDEGSSVATTMGVKADTNGLFVSRPPRDLDSVNGSVTGNSLILPRPLDQNEEDDMEDDDVSTLTEYSMEDEDDNGSQATQNTNWTVVTTGTDSTTVPTRNHPFNGNMKNSKPRARGKRNLMRDGALLSNSQFKRRRKA